MAGRPSESSHPVNAQEVTKKRKKKRKRGISSSKKKKKKTQRKREEINLEHKLVTRG